jgi:membrane peptidoglycan carboxypeptidase
MSSFVSHTVRFRDRRRSRAQRQPLGRLGLGCSTLVSLFLVLSFLAALAGYTALVRDLPSLDELPVLLDPPDGLLLQPTRLYDRSGQQVILALENPAAAPRSYLPVSGQGSGADPAQPEAVIQATLASLDPTFWNNPGYTLEGWRTGTHPTLAQRLVVDLLLWDEPPSLLRNLRERLLAAQVVSRFGRARVLEWYLNSAA